MRVVVALGGNALLRRGEPMSAAAQEANVAIAARAIADLAESHDVVVTHGNGPQVGLLALQAAAFDADSPWPLDLLGAESEGMIGYLIERALVNHLPDRRVATLLTQVEVTADDPAFSNPTKPIGPVYDDAKKNKIQANSGWTLARDGDGWRRVVPSPAPVRILEIATIRHLVAEGVIVICAGGGGIPVVIDARGAVHGVEAVIDKDRTAALLARELG
ncbi:MAG TPA: carbamate kinase, partial [Alphaproteobacteria bacterium]|nr:carbamate kinase [Alphaproteobacteria bacterium]